jgi:hypothetical protein
MIVSQFTIGNSQYHGFGTHHRVLLTNLGTKPYYFRLALRSRYFQLDRSVAYSVERSSSFMLDIVQPSGPNAYRGRYIFSVIPQETVRIQLRPFDVASWAAPQHTMEALGHVELTIPEVATGFGGSVAPQGDDPVPVLLHAFQVDWSIQTGYRDASGVAISTGKAENEIVPDRPKTLVIGKALEEIVESIGTGAGGAEAAAREQREDVAAFIDDPRSIGTVMAFLARVGEDRENLDALNALLREAGHALRVSQ